MGRSYTKIPNEIIEALCHVNLSSYESRVLWLILRKTYGFHKKTDWISLSQFSKETGIDRRNICKVIKKLSTGHTKNSGKGIIIINKANRKKPLYGLQEDYKKWSVPLSSIHRDDEMSSKQMTELPSIEIPTKESLTKENLTKQGKVFNSEDLPYKLSIFLLEEITKNNPHSRLCNLSEHDKEKKIQLWAQDIDKLLKVDRQEASTVKEVIEWSQKHDFWGGIILSGKKLREKWDNLTGQMAKRKKEQSPPYHNPLPTAKEMGIDIINEKIDTFKSN